MLNILVIGSGAREHAIVRAINRSPKKKEIHCLATNYNPGIAEICNNILVVNINDPDLVKNYAKEHKINFSIIGPENPLANGIADVLSDIGIGSVGPKKNLAQIETSKSFTRNLLTEYKIPGCPKFKTFSSVDGVDEFLLSLGENYVVKYDGLAGGKGVKVAGDHLHSHEEARSYCEELIDKGGTFVIEKKLIGEEFSLMSFCDGTSCAHMPVVQDHKRAFEGDTGPNTGGMGTYSFANHSLPFLSKQDVLDAQQTNERVALELYKQTGQRFRGILYGGFMLTKKGVKVIEYNARFGDPEAMNVLSILETDFIEICNAIVSGSLASLKISFKNEATVCKYAVPVGYPDSPSKNFEVFCNPEDHNLYLAAVQKTAGGLIATGSRTAAFVGINQKIGIAEKLAEKGVSGVKGNLFHRKDIGTGALINLRIKHMKEILR